MSTDKIAWQGTLTGVQPRIRLRRSYDQRNHSYLGYVLQVQGRIGAEDGEFLIGIGKVAQEKHAFQAGDFVRGKSEAVADQRREPVAYYKTAGLALLSRGGSPEQVPPPWRGVAPSLTVYRERGHRRLDARTYEASCRSCIWGCRMPVDIIVDQWNPDRKRFRIETFCYGPKSCSSYKAGPTRKVPGRSGMTWEEEDWVDDDATSHRAMDD